MLLDDELPGLAYLKLLCEQLPELEVVKAFNNPEVFLSEIPRLDFDLCILDVEMPQMNGLQVANLLRDKPVIFTTAYKEYAAEAFDLDAVDYIRKPVQKERLEQAVQKAMKRIHVQPRKDFMQLNADKGKAVIFFDQIAFITTADNDSRDKVVYFKDGTERRLKNISFDRLLEVLPPDRFCRINKKEIIALSIVQVFTFDEITAGFPAEPGKTTVFMLSEIYRDHFLQKIKA